jgi:hypothetical protein
MRLVWGTREVHTELWWEDLLERNHFKDLDIDGRIIKMYLKRCGWGDVD